ncbi:hypothetical protein YC2023_069081 [Brassica napus]
MSSVAINHRFSLRETIKKLIFPARIKRSEEEAILTSQLTYHESQNLISKEQGCKYIRLERRLLLILVKKFRLPEDADGVLTVTVEKVRPQPPKPKTLQIAIS